MIRRVLMLTVAALAGYLAVSEASARDALAPVMQTSPAQVLPPDLVALEQKMAQLRVTSERFSVLSRGTVKLTNESNGKPAGRAWYVSLNGTERGEISLSPNEAKISISNHAGVENDIFIGSTAYRYWPKLARFDGGRPWVRSHAAGPSTYPFEGSGKEVDVGGAGPYAHLINLLATAAGVVVEAGSVTVDGQKAYEFRSVRQPATPSPGPHTGRRRGPRRGPARRSAHRLHYRIRATGSRRRERAQQPWRPERDLQLHDHGRPCCWNVSVRVNAPAANRTIGQAL
jgi:hypothetical protein